MKILILHGLDNVDAARRTSINHAFFLPRHAPGHDYWLQSVSASVTEDLLNETFDAIVLETTFLCWRWAKPAAIHFEPLKRKYDFVRKSDAVKIAFPQDEPDHSFVLDDWLTDWKVDVVYSVYHPHRAEFYRRLSKRADIRFGYTGLVEPTDIAMVSRYAMPWRTRRIDVGYRASRLAPNFGWFGALKSELGERFKAAAAGKGLTLDISCDAKDAIRGDGWLRFLGQCRFVLGCESGQSIFDPTGSIKDSVDAYLAARPNAPFEEVEANCFPGQDRKAPFTCISPRLFEAAAAGCVQILIPGDYDGAIKPWEHYIPLEPDASNIDEIVAAMADEERMVNMLKASQKALIENSKYGYATYAADVLGVIAERRPDLPPVETVEPLDGLLRLALKTGERWSAAWPRWWQSR